MRITNIAAATVSTRYFHTDHLGSVSVITDENGAVIERLSYDAWGKRRFASGADDPAGSITSQSPRGFTGEEQLDTVGLVHLNGRVYDPLVGRMISADPTVPDPLNAQAWNRYSYVGNDPLAFTDPSGFNWFSNFFRSIGNFFNSVVNFFRENFRAILQIAISAALNAILPFGGALLAVASAAGGAAIATGLTGGNLSQVLRAGLIAGATAFAFFEVGSATNAVAKVNPDAAHIQPAFGTDAYAFNVAGHALVGCGAAVANGSSCGSGALSGAVTAGAGPLVNGQSYGVALAENAVIGGVASVAGGGKFANGAVTGAFGYMFNAAAGRVVGSILGGAAAGALGIESGPGAFLAAAAGHYAGGELGSGLEDLVGTALQSFYPTNSGFLGETTRDYLYPGQQIDRYGGSDYSQFFSPVGTPADARSLPPGVGDLPLRTFEVLKPFEVESGVVAPAFGQFGLGTQFRTPVPLGTLIDRGIIQEVR